MAINHLERMLWEWSRCWGNQFTSVTERPREIMRESSQYPQDRSHEMDEELRAWFDRADWLTVPSDLAYVAEAARAYSLIRWVDPDRPVREFISEHDRMALQSIADQIRERKDLPRIERFLGGRPMTHHPESARIHGLLEVLDELGLRFE